MKKELLKTISSYTLKSLAFLGTTIGAVVILLVMSILLICHGPSLSARQLFVTTVLETGHDFARPSDAREAQARSPAAQTTLLYSESPVRAQA